MKISESWLREWVNPDMDSEALARQLTMLGLEVDGLEPVAGPLDGCVVGEVIGIEPHPDADRLSLCQVDAGQANALNIVCGAPNVRVGARYPVALIGAQLPGGVKIRRSKIRGQPSEGMLCSAVELGIGESSEGILELDPAAEVGAKIVDTLDLTDQVIDLDLTPNRADCFCVLGVARDLAAGLRMSFSDPVIAAVDAVTDTIISVSLNDGAGCGRFVGRAIHNIDTTARTPLWMQERLRRCGIRPIYPAVDVTNLVMLELGQPLHGYDLDRLTDGITVRRADAAEQLELLTGESLALDPEVLVIADGSGAIGMAGIMGGQSTAVSELTQHVFLEAAYFCPEVIAGRGRRFGLHTDASLRFERGVDPRQQGRAIERATTLLLEIAGGEPGPLIDVEETAQLPKTEPITLRKDRLATVLGVRIPDDEVKNLLGRLQMAVEEVPDGWSVMPPSARFDISIEADLIEEVVRLYGYEHIPEIPGEFTVSLGAVTETRVPLERVRDALVARGYQEAITYSFVDPDLDQAFAAQTEAIALTNPISSELAVMRQSLWPGLVQALRHNLSRQQGRVRLFETGIRFFWQNADIIEENVVSGLAAGQAEPEQWDGSRRAADLFDIKADIESLFAQTGKATEFEFCATDHTALRPGRSAQILRSGEPIGWLGELHPSLTKKLDLAVAPILFEISLEPALAAKITEYEGISKYPAVRRDIAAIVSCDLPVASIEKAVREAAGPSLRDSMIFDVYEGKNIETGYKSVALGLILQETSRTLTDADADDIRRAVIDRLSSDFNATIRE
ncbi:MAG: phenylalanine--tRNA ligase subunit beta [Gammaproteobacteria bacterium]|nr:phenylalanine--tRNA ligase subunit beta [Gammaproteobacteria bacterium]